MTDPTSRAPRQTLDRVGLLNLLVVYVVWGSTYLAIRVAVREGAGFPPFFMAMMRVVAASAFLLGWARLRRERLRLTRAEFLLLGGSGLLLWVGGNGLVTWAEMRASSGLAALLVAAMPIWGELISMVWDRRPPAAKMAGSILLGFLGVGLLTWPILRTGIRADVLAVVALLLAPLFWALGSIWYQRRRTALSTRAVAGWQQLLGGAGFLAMVLLRGEPLAHAHRRGLAGLGLPDRLRFGDRLHRLHDHPATPALPHRHDLRLRQPGDRRVPGLAAAGRGGHRLDPGRRRAGGGRRGRDLQQSRLIPGLGPGGPRYPTDSVCL